jgi:chaperone modulatory protein CbpM
MIPLEDLLRMYHIERVELMTWIEAEWVRPHSSGSGWMFDDVDEARVKLIGELCHDLRMDKDALPVVLDLLDQLYAMRGVLSGINAAIRNLPEPLRDQMRLHLRSIPPADSDFQKR